MSDSTTHWLTDEIRGVLSLADGPLTTAEIYERCELAESSSTISQRLYGLRKQGYVERTDDGRYRLTDKPAPRTSRKPTKENTSRKPAPKAATPRPSAVMLDVLTAHATQARSTLEQYVTNLGDPVLNGLLESASSAQSALDAYLGRER